MPTTARSHATRTSLDELAALLRTGRGPLIARWCQRVLADPTVPEAHGLPMPSLQDHIPDLIDKLAESVERAARGSLRPAEPIGRQVGHADAAVAHAQERFAQGYSTAAALRELSHFRAALLDLCLAEGIALDGEAALLVHSAIDEAMSLAAIAIERAARGEVEAVAERLRIATESADLGTWDWDVASDVLNWDARVREIFGVAPDAPVTYEQTFAAAIHPEDRARVEALVQRALEPHGSGEYHAEHRIISGSDGAERWVASRARAFFDQAGRPLRLVGALRDITDAKRSEAALRVLSQAGAVLTSSLDYESTLKAFAELTAENLADYCMVDMVDARGGFRRLELAARDPARREILRRATPFAPSNAPGSPFRHAIETRAPLLVPRVTPEWLDALADSPSYRETLRALAPRSAMLVPLVARDRVLGVLKLLAAGSSRPYDERDLALAVDLARRAAVAVDNARLYREARDALNLLDTFLASAPVGFALLDRDLRFLRVNDTLAGMNALPREAHVGRFVGDLLPTLPDWYLRMLRHVLETGEPVMNLEMAMETPAGSEAGYLLGSYYPVRGADGAVIALGCVVADITERKRHEEETRREAEFRERVLAIVGHDLRTPLAAITFSAARLSGRGDVPEGEARALARIAVSAGRMERMISDLLDVTRVRQGSGIPLARRPTDLRKLCEQVVDEVRAAHPARRMELACRGNCEGEWDPDRVAQVLSNLLVNAADYSPPDTPVRVDLDGTDPVYVALSVHNEGPGIPPDRVATIFEPFKRGTSSGAKGLGLGLFIAHEVVRAHGGAIEVASSDAGGTRFVVRLPRASGGVGA